MRTNKGSDVVHRGLRFGFAALAFGDLGAHRFWLDVKTHNVRAKALYDKEGFIEEGRLRECVRTDGGYESLVVMSLLESEYAERCTAGLEAAA